MYLDINVANKALCFAENRMQKSSLIRTAPKYAEHHFKYAEQHFQYAESTPYILLNKVIRKNIGFSLLYEYVFKKNSGYCFSEAALNWNFGSLSGPQ